MPQTFPTPDQIASAIKIACSLTGESPMDVINKESRVRARHYALQALRTLFPGAAPADLALALGAPENPLTYWKYSNSHIFRKMVAGPRAHMRIALWWDEKIYRQVVSETSKVR